MLLSPHPLPSPPYADCHTIITWALSLRCKSVWFGLPCWDAWLKKSQIKKLIFALFCKLLWRWCHSTRKQSTVNVRFSERWLKRNLNVAFSQVFKITVKYKCFILKSLLCLACLRKSEPTVRHVCFIYLCSFVADSFFTLVSPLSRSKKIHVMI